MLTQESHPCWYATCDRCDEGDNSDYGGSFHYESAEQARTALQDLGWMVLDDGRCLCLECFEELRSQVQCPHGAHCTGGGCGACPSDQQVFGQLARERT